MELRDTTLMQLCDVSWAQVHQMWRANEDLPQGHPHEHWSAYWQSKGHESWETWRAGTVATLGLASRAWSLWRVPTPMVSVPNFHGGPYKGWRDRYYHTSTLPTFRGIIGTRAFDEHPFMLGFIGSPPRVTTLMGLVVGGDVIILDGMHRCVAFALAQWQHTTLPTEVQIHLASWDSTELLPAL